MLWVAIGGGLGASLRYITSVLFKFFYPSLPFGTIFVNILGSFLIGYLITSDYAKNLSQDFVKFFLIIGLLGSFTTFSAFSYEVINLINSKKMLISFLYIFISIFFCIFSDLSLIFLILVLLQLMNKN